MQSFDYLIVGGGSAGSLLANRLVTAGKRVCVIEAGPSDTNPFIRMPAGFVKTLMNPEITWRFETEGSEWTNGRKIAATQGKTLGGSGSVNGMVYIRGQQLDFDRWAEQGNPGWRYADVLPYFKKFESRSGEGDDEFRGRSGELPVTDATWRHPLCDAYISAASKLGLATNVDYNGERTEGTGYYQRVINRERRVSAADAFLRPVEKSKNLIVKTGCLVTKILVENNRAVGVEYLQGSSAVSEIRAGEVIVSAGAINSPKLLMLSGIGDPEQLKSHGIDVVHALPGVGANLSDHYSPRVVARVRNITTINDLVRGARVLPQAAKWLFRQPSVLGMAAAVVYGFGRSHSRLPTPDFTVIFTPASYQGGKLGVLDSYPGITTGAWQMRPESRGTVRLKSRDAHQAPIIQPNYLDAEIDRRVLVAGLRFARKVLSSSDFAMYFDEEMLPGAKTISDDGLLEFAKQYGTSSYHYCGTCKMGPATDPMAVVDERLRVRGVKGLRIVDASIMPSVTSGNTYAPTLMIAEKAADMILSESALGASAH